MDLRWPFYAPTSSSPPISLSDAEELTRQLVASNRERQQAMETSHGPLSGGNCSSIVTLVDPPRRRSSTPATLHAVPTSMVTANARVERIRRALKRIELALQYRERNPYLSSSTPKTTDDPDSSTAGQRSPPGLDGSVGSTAGLSALGSKSTDPSIPPVMARAGASTWSDAALQAITSPSADFQSVTSTGSTIFSSSAVPGEVCGQDVLSPFERIRVARLLGEIAVEVSAISIAHPAPSGIPQGSFSYGSPIRNASTRNLSETGHVESGQAVASLSESATTQLPRGGAVTAEPSTEVPTAAEPTTVAVTNVPSYLLPYVVAEANAATVPNLAATTSAAHLDRLVASQHLTPSTSRTSLGEPEERRLQAGRDPISAAEVGATEDRPLAHTHQRGAPPPPPRSSPAALRSRFHELLHLRPPELGNEEGPFLR